MANRGKSARRLGATRAQAAEAEGAAREEPPERRRREEARRAGCCSVERRPEKVAPKGPEWSREGLVILKSGVIRHRIGAPDWESKSGDTRQGVWPGESSGGKLSTRFIRFFRPFSGQQKEASEGRRDKGRGSAQNQVGEITQAHSRDKLACGRRSTRLIRFFRRSRASRKSRVKSTR